MKNSSILDQDFEILKQTNKYKSLEHKINYEISENLEDRLKILRDNKNLRAIPSNKNQYTINEDNPILNLSNLDKQLSYMLTNERFYKLDALGNKKKISIHKLFVQTNLS